MLLTKYPANRAGVGDCLKHDFVKAREERFEQIGDSFNESLGCHAGAAITFSSSEAAEEFGSTAMVNERTVVATLASAMALFVSPGLISNCDADIASE